MQFIENTGQVQEAAVIGVAHPKWTERPLLIVVKEEGSSLTRDSVLKFLEVLPFSLALRSNC